MKIHHFGFVVENIDSELKYLHKQKLDNRVYDPVQKAELVSLIADNQTMIELISPKDEQSFTWNYLKKNGGGFHHICYEVENLDEAKKFFQENRILKVLGPVDAVLFNRKVIFGIQRNKSIIELVFD